MADSNLAKLMSLTHFKLMFHFYTPWKHQKTSCFLRFSEGIEMDH